MKASKIIIRILCVGMAALTLVSASACGKKKTATNATKPTFGHFTSKGYELPYEYSDGYRATMKVPSDSTYETVSTTPGGNKVVHLKTSHNEGTVKQFYEVYFKELVKVKAKKETDHSVGYFDKDARLILFNFKVWTADDVTNFSLGTEACEKLEDSKLWEKADDDKTEPTTKKSDDKKTEATKKSDDKKTETTKKSDKK